MGEVAGSIAIAVRCRPLRLALDAGWGLLYLPLLLSGHVLAAGRDRGLAGDRAAEGEALLLVSLAWPALDSTPLDVTRAAGLGGIHVMWIGRRDGRPLACILCFLHGGVVPTAATGRLELAFFR